MPDSLDTFVTGDEAQELADYNRLLAASYRRIATEADEPDADMALVLCEWRQSRSREWAATAAEVDAQEEAAVMRQRQAEGDELDDPLAAARGVTIGMVLGVTVWLILAGWFLFVVVGS